MLHYLLQVSAFQLLFLLAFELLLKKETFFNYNRVYLLVTPVLAMLLPLLKIPLLQTSIPSENVFLLQEVFIAANPEISTSQPLAPNSAEAAQSVNWWFVAYCAGFLVNLSIFYYKFRELKLLFNYKPVLQNAELKIVEVPNSKIACTFYNTIFLGNLLSEKEREQILSHEMVHLRQRHTLDLLFFELLKIIFWFNPLIYIYQSRISALHEYIADAGVVKNGKKQDYFQQLLNSAFNTENISFLNQFFNHSLIKKRIIMLQKSKSKTVSKLKYLLIIPLMLMMLFYVACSENVPPAPVLESSTSQSELAIESYKIKEIVVENSPNTLKTHEVPDFSECENLASKKDLEECMSRNFENLVGQNFDYYLGEQLGLQGFQRIYVQIRITDDGTIGVLGTRAPDPALEKEAERVMNLLPKMLPGTNPGIYSIPITLWINRDQQ